MTSRGNMSNRPTTRASMLAWVDLNGGKATCAELADGLHINRHTMSGALSHACIAGVMKKSKRKRGATYERADPGDVKPVAEKWHGIPAAHTYRAQLAIDAAAEIDRMIARRV